jgi:hypothetical protein
VIQNKPASWRDHSREPTRRACSRPARLAVAWPRQVGGWPSFARWDAVVFSPYVRGRHPGRSPATVAPTTYPPDHNPTVLYALFAATTSLRKKASAPVYSKRGRLKQGSALPERVALLLVWGPAVPLVSGGRPHSPLGVVIGPGIVLLSLSTHYRRGPFVRTNAGVRRKLRSRALSATAVST